MQRSMKRKASNYLAQKRRHRIWARVIGVLACVVVFCTTYALILPALTLTAPTVLNCTYETLGVHQHTDGCYDAEGNLICGYADFVIHTHDESCYDADGNLICTLPEIAPHTHTASCFEESSVLTCGQEESEGHVHTDECYQDVYDEDGNLTGRELICGKETSEGHTHTDACYSLQLTQICGQEEIKLHTHDESCYDAEGNLICGQLEIVEHVHTDECFVAVEESAPAVYTYENETISVQVTLAENSAVPQDAELVVRPITGADAYGEDGSYEDLVRQAEQAVDRTVTEILLYDISFYTSDGTYLPVEDTATVSIQFRESVLPAGADEIAVLHYAEDGDPAVLDADVERDENDEVSAVTFETGGFSNFAIALLAETDGDTETASGNSFTLTYTFNGTDYTITFHVVDAGGNAVPGTYNNITAEGATLYKFSEIAPKIDGYTYSHATGSNISGTNSTDTVVSVSTNGYEDGGTEYTTALRFYLTDPIVSGQWHSKGKDANDREFTVTLTYVKELNLANDQTFVLFNPANNMAMLASSTILDGKLAAEDLSSFSPTQDEEDGYYYLTTYNEDRYNALIASLEGIQIWSFEEVQNQEGRYYLTTTVSGSKQYVEINGASVTLVAEPNENCVLTVAEGTGQFAGQVRLTNSSDYAINRYGDREYFGGWKGTATTTGDKNEYFYLVAGAKLLDLPGTVDGVTPTGTVINLFDYWAVYNGPQYDADGNLTDGDYTTEYESGNRDDGINNGHFLKFTRNQTDGANNYTGSAAVYSGIVQNILKDDFPVLTENLVDSGKAATSTTPAIGSSTSEAESLDYLFDPDYTGESVIYRNTYRNVGGLLQVDSQGYYYYDAQLNFAELNTNTNQFTLYESGGVLPGGKDTTLSGQFFPFNSFADVIDKSDSSDYLNHYFGATMTTRFVQRYDGFTSSDRKTPVEFEFAGDDDVWIFIDDVLVADLGGIHDRASVNINFATGEITVNGTKTSTLYEMFQAANKEDDVDWSEDENEDGSHDTFANNTYHTLKLFYLERGNGSSNLHLKYNLASYPPTGITKVNQYGEAVSGAKFAVYPAEVNGETWTYDETKAPAHTGTTDATGKMAFVDKDNMPYTMDKLKQRFGEYFVLKETQVPDGYRLVSDEIRLHIQNGVLLCENTWDSGVWADTNLLVSAPNEIKLATGTYNDKNTVNAATTGTIFAVVLKYTGSDVGHATTDNLEKEANWAPLYGTAANGFIILDAEARQDTGKSFIEAAIYAAQNYVKSQNEFALGASGALEGTVYGMPGKVSNYYYMLPESQKGQTEYTVAYYWTSADSLEEATASNTYRVDADASGYAFDRVFGATINVPNLINGLYVQKFSEDGERVNGATFALYRVEEDETEQGTIYYLDKDGSRVLLTDGQYTIDPNTGVITITDKDGNPTDTTITPYIVETAMTAEDENNKTDEDGTAIFTLVKAGTYYLREIAAPKGYKLNETEVMVYITDNAVYANAGAEDDGVTVARGPGYIAKPLDQFASIGDVNNTLSWVYERMKITGVSNTFTAFNDGTGWAYLTENRTGNTSAEVENAYTVHLVYANDEDNELFNFTVNGDWYRHQTDEAFDRIYTDKQIAALTRRLYTTVGWSYYELYQDYSTEHAQAAADRGATYEDLTGKEIANLFSRAVFVQFTDPYADGTLEISKIVSGADTDNTSDPAKIADPATLNSYDTVLLPQDGTHYAGAVWTDKTVSAGSITVEGNTYAVDSEAGEDFLNVFSALGSSQSVNTVQSHPLDVMIVLDLSGSMMYDLETGENNFYTTNGNNTTYTKDFDITKTRIYAAVQAANEAIETLMENPNTRVGLVVFSSQSSGTTNYYTKGAKTLLPLGRYSNGTSSVLSVVSGSKVTNAPYKELYYLTASATGLESPTPVAVYGSTNTQVGLYQGLLALYQAQDITVDMDGDDEKETTRIPAVIFLSDGEPTVSSSYRYWAFPTYGTWSEQGSGTGAYYGNGMLAMMTAASMKNWVNTHYGLTADSEYATKIYTIGVGIDSLTPETSKELGLVTLDPRHNLDSTTNSMAVSIRNAWEEYCTNDKKEDAVAIPYGAGTSDKFNLYHLEAVDELDLTSGTEPLKYNDDYYETQDISAAFEDIVERLTSYPFVPTTDANANSTGIHYTDPLGAFMEVKEVKAVLIDGKSVPYNAEKSGNGKYVYTIPADEAHPIYGTQIGGMDITVEVTEDANGMQTVTVDVPSEVLPAVCQTVTIDKDGSASVSKESSLPLRVLYTVGVKEAYKTDGVVDLDKIAASTMPNGSEYLGSNTDSGSVYFYSNLYSGSNASGDATVSFVPSQDNRYYFFQHNRVIYSTAEVNGASADSFPPDAILKTVSSDGKTTENGNCTVSGPVTTGSLDAGTTYYLVIDYYDANGNHVYHVVARTGAELKDSVELVDSSVTVDSADGIYTELPSQVLATTIGAPRPGRLNWFHQAKTESSETGTAQYYYYPTYSEDGSNSITVYLGNNGRLGVPVTDAESTGTGESNSGDETVDQSGGDAVSAARSEVDTESAAGEEVVYVPDGAAFQFQVDLYNTTTDPESGALAAGDPLTDGTYEYTVYNVIYDENGEETSRVLAGNIDAGGNPLTVSHGGTISLGRNQVAVITGLPVTTAYTVTEKEPGNYTPSSMAKDYPEIVTTGDASVSGFIRSTTMGGGTISKVVFTNTPYAEVTLVKTNMDGNTFLSGAVFRLSRTGTEDETEYTEYYCYDAATRTVTWDKTGTELTTDGNGEVTLHNLPDGTYTLTEITAPSDYLLPEQPFTFVLKGGKIMSASSGQNSAPLNKVNPEDGQPSKLYIPNSTGSELPHTGGVGTQIYIFSGLLFMAAAVMCKCILRRKREGGHRV